MNIHMNNYIVKAELIDWKPLIEKEIHYEGVFVKSLHFDKEKQRSTTILIKFEKGSSYPYHNHPAGEELFVLEGEVIIEGALLKKGDYLFTPPGCKHSVRTEIGCTILFIIPEEVEII